MRSPFPYQWASRRGTAALPAYVVPDGATSDEVLLTAFGEIARQLLGDRARPIDDGDRDAADELLDSVDLLTALRLLGPYFRCTDEAIRQQGHSFIWFCGFVLVVSGMSTRGEIK